MAQEADTGGGAERGGGHEDDGRIEYVACWGGTPEQNQEPPVAAWTDAADAGPEDEIGLSVKQVTAAAVDAITGPKENP